MSNVQETLTLLKNKTHQYHAYLAQQLAGSAPYIHITKSVIRSCGGVAGSITYIDWDGTELNKDSIFTHSTVTNASRIYVTTDGHYELKSTVGIDQDGGRATQMLRYRLDGTTNVIRGTSRSYSSGSSYGDMSVFLNTEMDLLSGQYLEVYTEVDNTQTSSADQNTHVDECEFILRKLN